LKIHRDTLLEVKHVHRSFNVGTTRLDVLKDINLTIEKGTFNLLLGPSGSGKTTLLNLIGTLDKPDQGQIVYENTDVSRLSEVKRDKFRRYKLGYIFQSVALVANMTAYENLDFFLRIAGLTYKERQKRIQECLDFVGLGKRTGHFPSQMSGGEQQRVAIARSISHKPPLILADEPTAELDTETGILIIKLFKKMVEEEGITIIMCTHDRNIIEMADHVFEMEDGVIISV
jgi:putative ABC transport system ATP-binding protein